MINLFLYIIKYILKTRNTINIEFEKRKLKDKKEEIFCDDLLNSFKNK